MLGSRQSIFEGGASIPLARHTESSILGDIALPSTFPSSSVRASDRSPICRHFSAYVHHYSAPYRQSIGPRSVFRPGSRQLPLGNVTGTPWADSEDRAQRRIQRQRDHSKPYLRAELRRPSPIHDAPTEIMIRRPFRCLTIDWRPNQASLADGADDRAGRRSFPS